MVPIAEPTLDHRRPAATGTRWEIRSDHDGTTLTLLAPPTLGLSAVATMRATLRLIGRQGPDQIVVDLSRVKELHPCPAAVLVGFRRRMRALGTGVTVAVPEGPARTTLHSLGLAHALLA